jgi:hypothetical protein
MSAICPVYPEHQTFPDLLGTSHLGQERTSTVWPLIGDKGVTEVLSPGTMFMPEREWFAHGR